MSSAGVTVADVGPQMYFCHQCNRTVDITPSSTDELLCPTCNSGFVEKFENPNPDPYPTFSDAFHSLFSSLLFPSHSHSSSSVASSLFTPSDLQNPRIYSSRHSRRSNREHESPVRGEREEFNPYDFLFSYLTSRQADGVNFEFVFEGSPFGGEGSSLLPGNIGDYFIGAGFEDLIQQLAENDPNRYGTPPASKSAVAALPTIKANKDLLSSELAQCAVCKDDFELGMEVKQMPCKHVYHNDCILPWLELHNSCPVCRYELPTDDPDYESRARENGGGSAAGSSGNSSQGQRTLERRFTISLPRPPTDFGRSPDGGDSESGWQQNRDSN
ncbi:PREDICTED: E3 ubiquitin-protein ligase RING1 [Ipomoea nil]|uniref:E3 ubiquitin-protein ligase RING1 n=1 Tax=Ipomoea nil TaxID=35883 RepID=UPI000901DD7A|nr:PREDICTED: E3 ubiquitin-protein ligase RING1 [Ipomoea nil]